MIGRQAVSWVGLGVFLGLAWGQIQPRRFEAQTTLFFPDTRPQVLERLTEALQARPEGQPSSPSTENAEMAQFALLILKGRSAAEFAAKKAGDTSRFRWSGLDPIDELQTRLNIELTESNGVVLQARANSAEKAQLLIQGLLEFYSETTKKNAFTRVHRTRLDLDHRLELVVKQLTQLEEKLSQSSTRELRNLGDAAISADPKVMTRLWMKRVDEEQKNREILARLERLRVQGGKSPLPGGDWLSQWSSENQRRGLKPHRELLLAPVRRQDLLQRARLERNYYELLLTHRSLVLQRSFVLTWEQLESTEFEVVDPLTIRSLPRSRVVPVTVCGLLGGLLYLLWAMHQRRRRGAAGG